MKTSFVAAVRNVLDVLHKALGAAGEGMAIPDFAENMEAGRAGRDPQWG